MKIIIGNYTTWIGPYQIAEKILFWMDKDDERVFALGEFFAHGFCKEDPKKAVLDDIDSRPKTWLYKLCEWVHSKKKRKVSIQIDRWDTYSMDATLSMIILPMLKQLKNTKHGAPFVDDEDVPVGIGLRSSEAPQKQNEWDVDENHFERWDWILDEIIWTFEQIQPDYDWEEQYRSGEIDIRSTPCAWDEKGKPTMHEIQKGPNDTYNIDMDARTKHQDRINNGLRLFARYYESLWD